MFTSYIIDKAGFTLLCMLIGGRAAGIPQQLYEAVDDDNYEAVLKRLSDIGYIHIAPDRVDIERTINFLISEILGAGNADVLSGGKRLVFHCSKLIIIAEEDRLSPKKCRIVPIRDEAMLAEYFSECDDEINYTREE